MTNPNQQTCNLRLRSERMPVGGGFTVAFSLMPGRLEVEWEPRAPVGRKGRKYLPAYRLARDEFLRRVALKIGANVGVIEL